MKKKSRVEIGTQVDLELLSREGERQRLIFDLVADHQADIQNRFLGVGTHLGKTILGESPGILIPYFTDEFQGVEILSVAESTRKPPADTSAQREANLQAVKDQIEFTNAVLFASSANTKWGEYNAEGLDFENWQAKHSEEE